jgi:molybdate transport system substrate-binding protein
VRRLALLGAAAAACAVGAPALVATAAPVDDQPVVLAAASLTEVLPRIGPAARYSFGSSSQLAQQIRQGAPADVFLSASPVYTRELYATGLVRRPVAFATNRLVLIVPRRNPAAIRSVADLARRPGLKLVLAGARAPIGLYTRELLKRLGLLRVLRKAVSQEPDVKGVVAKVALGEADAGFVYATDVHPVAAKVLVIQIPQRAQPSVRYEAAIVSSSQRLTAAQDLLISLLGPDGRRQLRRAGFGIP